MKEMNSEDLQFGNIIALGDDVITNQFDFASVANAVEDTIREAFKPIDSKKLKGWKVDITIVYKRARYIYFGKRGTSVPSDQTKEFFLRLAVPTLEQAPYGFNKKKFEYDDPSEKDFFKVPPNFNDYNSLETYLVDGARRVIEEVLKNGITINGEKLKLPLPS